MDFKALVGPGNQPFSRKADCQKSINVVRERVIGDQGVNSYVMYKAFGYSPLIQPSGAAGVNRGASELNDHDFTVIDDTVYDIDDALAVTTYGPVADDGLPTQMAISLNTLMVLSAGTLYRINGGTLAAIALTFTPIGIVFIDNYFVALSDALNQFYFSTDDGLTFPAGNVQDVESSPDKLLAMIVDNNVLYFYSRRQSQPFTVGTNAAAPFVPQQNAVIRQGIVAAATLQQIGSYRFWLGRNQQGLGRVFRGESYAFTDISTPAVVNAIREIARDYGIDDAIAQSYSMNDQEFYRLTFPAGNKTFEYNVTIGDWNERLHWNWINGQYNRDRGNSIVAAFGKIIVGDHSNGWLYELSPDNYTDYGYPLRGERQCPHILQENKNVNYGRLELGTETGVGLENPLWLNNYTLDAATFATNLAAAVVATTVTATQALVLQSIYDNEPYTPLDPYPDADTMSALGFDPWGAVAMLADGVTVLGGPPQIAMKYSDTGAKNDADFHQSLERSLGAFGGNEDVYWDRLGDGRDRVFNLSWDHPCKTAITTAWLTAEALDP